MFILEFFDAFIYSFSANPSRQQYNDKLVFALAIIIKLMKV